MKFVPYLQLNGNAREAVEYYSKIFQAEILGVITFGEMPAHPEFSLPEEAKNLVANGAIKIGNKNKWSTTDSKQRSIWYYTLKSEKILENYVNWMNEIECPHCKQVVDKNSSKFAPDRYYYCYKCYDELASQYKFKKK